MDALKKILNIHNTKSVNIIQPSLPGVTPTRDIGHSYTASALSFVLPRALLAAVAIIGSTVMNPVMAEMTDTPVVRSGAFAIEVPSGQCDGILDTIEGIGEFIVEGLEYLGEKTLDTTAGLGSMIITGNPDAFIAEVNSTFSDLGSVAGKLTAYSPLALLSVVVDELPAGAVSSFIQTGTDFVRDTQASVAEEFVNGANPISIADTAINDLGEIATDIGTVLVNLDDPLLAASEFLELNQKWTGVGALTYIFTEGDPLTGMKKALSAMHRQVEIITTYAGGVPIPSLDIGGALLAHSLNESKKYIDAMPNGDEKIAAALFVASFSSTFTTQLVDPNFTPGNSRHPLYTAEMRAVEYNWLGNDHGSGGDTDYGLMHTVTEDLPGCINLGDHAYPGALEKTTLNAVCQVESGRDVWWSRPIDYKLVWGDNCSGGSHDLSIWKPVCEEGYVSVGFVASGLSHTKPLPNAIACLKSDPNILGVANGVNAGLKWVANDDNSGAKFFNLTVFNRKFLGMDLMYALNTSKAEADIAFVASLKVPITTPGIAPNGIDKAGNDKDLCVNFYSEANYKGWTHEACASDQLQSLDGQWGQMAKNGIKSFQCGKGIAGIEVYYRGHDGLSSILNCHSSDYNHSFDTAHKREAKILTSYVDSNSNLVLSPKTIDEQYKANRELARIAAEEALMSSTVDIEFVDQDLTAPALGTVVITPDPKFLSGDYKYSWGDTVTLTAQPNEISYFVGWTGAAASCGTQLVCDLTITEAANLIIKPSFREYPKLISHKTGKGFVDVTSSVVSQACYPGKTSSNCYRYPVGTTVTMTPTATDDLYVFDSWEGDTDCKDGQLTMTEHLTCNAVFRKNIFQLIVSADERSTITSEPAGLINCGPANVDCTEDFAVDETQTVTLTATLEPDTEFVRWDGYFDCYDILETDPLTTKVKAGNNKDVLCNAVTVKSGTEFALTVEKNAGGHVTATSLSGADSSGIECGNDACTQRYLVNDEVQLTAIASRGAKFTGFRTQSQIRDGSGGYPIYRNDTAENICYDGLLKMSENVTCIASFVSDVLVVDGSPSDLNKEQNPYLNVLVHIDAINVDIWDVKSPSSTSNPLDPITGERLVEPTAAILKDYGRVIWYSGSASTKEGGNPLAGPSAAAETDLAEYLDNGGCFMLSSPQYYLDRGLTPFMQTYLGVDKIIEDTGETDSTHFYDTKADGSFGIVAGITGSIDPLSAFSNRGPFRLTTSEPGGLPAFMSDTLFHNPDVPGSSVLMHYADGSGATVGVDNGLYRTAFFAYPFLGLPSGNSQIDVMDAFMDYCGQADRDDEYDTYQNNDNFVEASQLQSGVSLQSLIILPENSDYFTFVSNDYRDISISLSFIHDKGDLSLEVYDSQQNLIEASQGLSNLEQVLVTNVDAGQTYYIHVFGSNQVSNQYNLDIASTGLSDRDHDGVADVDDIWPDDASEHSDNDRDFIGDNADLDDDNDGLPDSYELLNNLNPLLKSDATQDIDADGYSNLEEFFSKSDPADATSNPTNVVITPVDETPAPAAAPASGGGGGGSLNSWYLFMLMMTVTATRTASRLRAKR